MLRSLEDLAGASSSWRREYLCACERCTPVVCTGPAAGASSSDSPPSADSELSAPSAPDLLSSCASGMADASGLGDVDVPDPPELPSRFAFCSSTLPERDRNVVQGQATSGPIRRYAAPDYTTLARVLVNDNFVLFYYFNVMLL